MSEVNTKEKEKYKWEKGQRSQETGVITNPHRLRISNHPVAENNVIQLKNV